MCLVLALASGQTYISEISPLKIRGITLASYTFCLVSIILPRLAIVKSLLMIPNRQGVGYLIAASISFTRVTIMDESAYKVLFAAEWCWPAALMAGAFLIPESPYFLVRKNRIEQANKSLSRLHGNKETSVNLRCARSRMSLDTSLRLASRVSWNASRALTGGARESFCTAMDWHR